MRVRPRVRGVSERVPGLWSRNGTLRREATGQESAHGVSGTPLPSDGARLAAEAAAYLADAPREGREAPRGGSNYRLLLPYTHSEPAERALKAAVDLSCLFSAEVWVLHVREWDEFGRGGRSYLESREEAVALVGGALEQLKQHGLTATGVLQDSARGRVPQEIAVKADELRADAIVVGARQRPLLSAALLGSISLGLMRRANCPVIVVHTPAR